MILEKIGPKHIRILAPAKLNLFLEITGKRSDGYHEIDSLMHSIDIYDELHISIEGDGPRLETSGLDAGPDTDNLALRAALLFNMKREIRTGFKITLNKKIPSGGGLGGGSSDCAAVLIGCNELTGNPFSREELQAMGAQLGSDVPFFFYCGTARCTGRGEKVIPISGIPPLNFVVFFPGFPVSTPKVYENLNLGLTNRNDNTRLLVSLKTGWAPEINTCFFNRLEKTVLAITPRLSAACIKLRHSGFPWLRITGSGSSMFQLIEEKKSANKMEIFNINCCCEHALAKSSPLISLQ